MKEEIHCSIVVIGLVPWQHFLFFFNSHVVIIISYLYRFIGSRLHIYEMFTHSSHPGIDGGV